LGIVVISFVPVSAILGTRMPLLVLFTSIIAPTKGSEPSLLMATFCAIVSTKKNDIPRKARMEDFFINKIYGVNRR
jgi:hypothetical protein